MRMHLWFSHIGDIIIVLLTVLLIGLMMHCNYVSVLLVAQGTKQLQNQFVNVSICLRFPVDIDSVKYFCNVARLVLMMILKYQL